MKIEIPWSQPGKAFIIPVFLPFMGCKSKCIYCAQHIQTGIPRFNLKNQLNECMQKLLDISNSGKQAPELAFYGGTFTSLEENDWKLCLKFALEMKSRGLISGFRCSTRPDAVSDKRLDEMVKAGCRMIELGIQSFNSGALMVSERGYTTEECLKSCELIKNHDLNIGLQLMPGMPGLSESAFLNDVEQALLINPECLRFYPCLVLRETRLAEKWSNGKYIPWSLEETIKILAEAWLLARSKNVEVIRMGLYPEPALIKSILAGPEHPSLGSRIMGRALLMAMKKCLQEKAQIRKMELPQYCRGYIWGWKNELAGEWEKIGVSASIVSFSEKDVIKLLI